MPENWYNLVVSIISGLAAGTLASLVAPWANWGVEKRRARLETRRKLIMTVLIDVRERRARQETLHRDHEFLRLRPHLSAAFVTMAESDQHVDDGAFQTALLGELARLEREWGLA